MMNIKKSNLILLAVVALFVMFSGGILFSSFVLKAHSDKKTEKQVSIPMDQSDFLNPVLPMADQKGLDFDELKSFRPLIDDYIHQVEKKNPDLFVSYYFRDLNNGLWTGINEKETFSPASLFKIPVMVAFLKKAEKDPEIFKLGMKYDKKALQGIEEESGFPKEDGKYYTTDELLTQMICYSDNTASLVLLNYVGEPKVKEVIEDMNIKVGPAYNEATNFVTVKAYAGMFRVLYNASYLNREMSEKALTLLSKSVYTKGIRKAIPADVRVAHKYGKRDLEGKPANLKSVQLHHFALVYHKNKPFLLGIMTRGADLQVKEQLIEDLARITYNEVDRQCKSKSSRRIFSE